MLDRPERKPQQPANVTPLAKGPAPEPKRRSAFSSTIVKRRLVPKRLLRLSVLVCIVLPTLLTAFYYLFIASDQYGVRTQFAVRGVTSGLDQLGFSQFLGSSSSVTSDSYIVVDYILSAEVIEDILRDQGLDLRKVFASDQADWFVRADPDDPINLFVDYWDDRIDVGFNSTTGIITFDVRAFSAEDAAKVAQAVLTASERLVNLLSEKARQELVRVARAEVDRTEVRLREARQRMQQFREKEQTIDPSQIATSQLKLIGDLESQLAELRARRDALLQSVDPNSPSVRVLDRQVAAMNRQIEEQRARLGTGTNNFASADSSDLSQRTLSSVFGDYTELAVEQEFAEKAYTSALAALEAAVTEGRKQQRYFGIFVEPRAPDISLYPERLLNTFLVFLASVGLWGISMLTVAAVREHTL
ncbi:hypothetical protein [Propylenella binzhouense]|uniref:Capsular polysaccharide transport system permease protein n=1 Tax=Propylenella binzhouense TaxID=2555902 RepID=A0A964T2I0_9HYPH|nr:hypothetical protein [Propylenella binzhouense]MYZ47050.1 hypothetical protein [Propylenella binzhouense]